MAALARALGFGRSETREAIAPSSITPKVLDPNLYAKAAILLSEEACRQSKCGAGAVLVDNQTGKALYSLHDRVIQDNATRDPSAHAERQIVSWYLVHRFRQRFPPPNEVTIITTIDPCIMCTGALLASGINAVSMSYDDGAGINWTKRWDFKALPFHLRPGAHRQLSYFAIPSVPWMGPQASVFYGQPISAELNHRAIKAFWDSVPVLEGIYARENPVPHNIAKLPDDNPQKKILCKIWPFAVDTAIDINESFDCGKLKAVLYVISAGSDNAAALIDPFGNLLLAIRSGPTIVDTALTNLLRAYTECRWQLKDSDGNRTTDAHLPHPKQCKIVLLNGPGRDATDILDLGLYGSAMHSKSRGDIGGFYYFNAMQTPRELNDMIQEMPPLYNKELGINPIQLQITKASGKKHT